MRTRNTANALDRRQFLQCTSAAIVASGLPGCGSELPRVPDRFSPVSELLSRQVSEQRIPGAVWLVMQDDEVVVQALGLNAIGGSTPMRRDTIFRIASMTKPVTASAVMMLVEEGKLRLDAPAEEWLPELANRRVLRQPNGSLDDTVPAERAITVHDLLAFTNGFGILFDETAPIDQEIKRLELANAEPIPMTPHSPDEWIRRLGTLPLMHQPGARWMYNTGSLIQGVLIRRASGQDFDAFLEERIFEPLSMRDTGFFVPAKKLHRFAGSVIFTDPATGQAVRIDKDGEESAYASPPVFPSGGAGLVSTADDFLKFARMLLRDGMHKGRRLLSAESVRMMTTNQLSPVQRAASEYFPPTFFQTHGWGYGVGVSVAPDDVSPVPGRYGWDGGFGTSWINDRARNLVSIVLTQSADFIFSGALDEYWRAVYAATANRGP